jgi:hypothetical protein
MTETRFNSPVWADGFGTWHATVPLSDPRTEARQARALIRAEVAERQGARPGRIAVTRERVTGHGTAVYVES